METRTALFCLGPAGNVAFDVRQVPRRRPNAHELEIAVEAASVNPIDVRRAEGYGLRLLSLLGAGKFPMVLGNDFAGTIVATGSKVSAVNSGARVFGLKRTSAEGTHASHVLVKAVSVLPAPAGRDLRALAAIPYQLCDDVARRAWRGTDPRKRGGKKSACARGRRRTGDISAADAVRMGGKGYRYSLAISARSMSGGRSRGRARRHARAI